MNTYNNSKVNKCARFKVTLISIAICLIYGDLACALNPGGVTSGMPSITTHVTSTVTGTVNGVTATVNGAAPVVGGINNVIYIPAAGPSSTENQLIGISVPHMHGNNEAVTPLQRNEVLDQAINIANVPQVRSARVVNGEIILSGSKQGVVVIAKSHEVINAIPGITVTPNLKAALLLRTEYSNKPTILSLNLTPNLNTPFVAISPGVNANLIIPAENSNQATSAQANAALSVTTPVATVNRNVSASLIISQLQPNISVGAGVTQNRTVMTPVGAVNLGLESGVAESTTNNSTVASLNTALTPSVTTHYGTLSTGIGLNAVVPNDDSQNPATAAANVTTAVQHTPVGMLNNNLVANAVLPGEGSANPTAATVKDTTGASNSDAIFNSTIAANTLVQNEANNTGSSSPAINGLLSASLTLFPGNSGTGIGGGSGSGGTTGAGGSGSGSGVTTISNSVVNGGSASFSVLGPEIASAMAGNNNCVTPNLHLAYLQLQMSKHSQLCDLLKQVGINSSQCTCSSQLMR